MKKAEEAEEEARKNGRGRSGRHTHTTTRGWQSNNPKVGLGKAQVTNFCARAGRSESSRVLFRKGGGRRLRRCRSRRLRRRQWNFATLTQAPPQFTVRGGIHNSGDSNTLADCENHKGPSMLTHLLVY